MRASAITRGIFKDWMKGPMTEEQYQAYMDALADEQDDDSSSDSDKDDDSDDDQEVKECRINKETKITYLKTLG